MNTPGKNVITVRKAPGLRHRAILCLGPLAFPAAIGRSGITGFKREGDGGTPHGSMKLLHGYRRSDRVRFAPSPLRLKPVQPRNLWCDEPRHACYNRPVSRPFQASHEEMWRTDRLYDICIVLDWNIRSRKRCVGSAIFFHLAHDDYGPTAGCVALRPRDMQRILPFLRRGTVLKVVK